MLTAAPSAIKPIGATKENRAIKVIKTDWAKTRLDVFQNVLKISVNIVLKMQWESQWFSLLTSSPTDASTSKSVS